MTDLDLYTVTVFQSTQQEDVGEDASPSRNGRMPDDFKFVEKYHNMISARIIDGTILELEHSNLAGPMVKFKTIVDFKQTIEPDTYLGLFFKHQKGYIAKE